MADIHDLSGFINLAVTLAHDNTQDDGAVVTDPLVASISKVFENGTGDGQADLVFHERRTLEHGGYWNYVLDGDILIDELGRALAFVHVKAIIIHSTLAANKVLTIGGGLIPLIGWVGAAGDKVKINPGGWLVLIAPNTGYPVSLAEADVLRVTNTIGGSTTYDIIIIGTSA
jgi:hypothetical protein